MYVGGTREYSAKSCSHSHMSSSHDGTMTTATKTKAWARRKKVQSNIEEKHWSKIRFSEEFLEAKSVERDGNEWDN